jgi:hypothetical protein
MKVMDLEQIMNHGHVQYQISPLHHRTPLTMTRSTVAFLTLLPLLFGVLFCEGFVPQYLRCLSGHGTVLCAKSGKKKKKPKDGTIAVNRVAYRNFEIVDTLDGSLAQKSSP